VQSVQYQVVERVHIPNLYLPIQLNRSKNHSPRKWTPIQNCSHMESDTTARHPLWEINIISRS